MCRVQNLIQLICDVKMMRRAVIEIGYDAEKLPLGKLSKAHIHKAIAILKDIEAAVKAGTAVLCYAVLCYAVLCCAHLSSLCLVSPWVCVCLFLFVCFST